MISEQAVQIMEEYADDAAKMLATFREMGREHGGLEGFEPSWRALIEVARLLNSDARLRDALGEARDRAAGALSGIQVVNLAAAERCAECGELTLVLVDGSSLCEACYDAANAVNLVPVGPQEQAAPMEDDEPIRPGVRVEVLHPQPSRNVFTNATLYKGSGGIVISADTGVLGDCWFVRLDRPKLPMWMGTETSFRAADLRVVTADEPDLAPSDAQDDEAGEVEIS